MEGQAQQGSDCARAIATQDLRTFNTGRARILHRIDEYLIAGNLNQRGFRGGGNELSRTILYRASEGGAGCGGGEGQPKQHAKACVIRQKTAVRDQYLGGGVGGKDTTQSPALKTMF